MDAANLEISLHRQPDQTLYSVEMRFSLPDSATDDRIDEAVAVDIDPNPLRQLEMDADGYGRALGGQLFADPGLFRYFERARSAAEAQNLPLRLRLFISPNAAELHSLRWETLRLPQEKRALLQGATVLFSRYLTSGDWRPVTLRPEGALRALVVAANPENLADFELAPVDVEAEKARVHQILGPLATTYLVQPGEASLPQIMQHLREGYDILYIVAHGALGRTGAQLYLVDDQNKVNRVSGEQLADQIGNLSHRPGLVVLASCQSAGVREGAEKNLNAYTALGPLLAQAGMPAVVAMLGSVSMQTAGTFMTTFFAELSRHGTVDHAAAVARSAILDQPDWWMPVLFMRLRNGRIWYTPGFGQDREALRKWPSLLQAIKREQCTPILGPGLGENMLGSRAELARTWADKYGFPLLPHSRENLPQVAQFVATDQGLAFVQYEYADQLRSQMQANPEAGEATIHQVLARLPLPIFVTTEATDLLADALRAAGKDPVTEICPWKEDLISLDSIYAQEPDYQPTAQRPLIFHLFGHLAQEDSLVLTEDDYFDYLVGVTANKELIPLAVRSALNNSALLFLGFHLDGWEFRILFRSIINRTGRRSRYEHVAAQINPEEGRILEPEGARHYLREYFRDAQVSIFWGSVDDFAGELERQIP